jgi:hypothetical protein
MAYQRGLLLKPQTASQGRRHLGAALSRKQGRQKRACSTMPSDPRCEPAVLAFVAFPRDIAFYRPAELFEARMV